MSRTKVTASTPTPPVSSRFKVIRLLLKLGPGLITGAADDDPSGISTYSVAGATTGFSMLWLTLISTPMMAVIQGMCARISMVTGEGLAAVMRKRLPLPMAYALASLVIVANTFNVGADLGAMAAATRLLVPGMPFGVLVGAFAVGVLALEVGVDLALEANLAAVERKAARLWELFAGQMAARCASRGFELLTSRASARRGTHIAFAHREGYRVMQALIARGVIGDFRAPDVLRFGFTPLYTRYVDVWDAVTRLRAVLKKREWDRSAFQVRQKVT